MNEHEHQNDSNNFECNRTHCDVGVFFQRLIQPVHSKRLKPDIAGQNQQQSSVFLEFRYNSNHHKQNDQRQSRGHHADGEQFFDRTRQFLPVIPYNRTCTNSIQRHSQRSEQHKIVDYCGSKIDFAVSICKKDSRDIRESD